MYCNQYSTTCSGLRGKARQNTYIQSLTRKKLVCCARCAMKRYVDKIVSRASGSGKGADRSRHAGAGGEQGAKPLAKTGGRGEEKESEGGTPWARKQHKTDTRRQASGHLKGTDTT